MVAISLRTVWVHKRRLVGTLVAVVLGVAFLSGTLLLGDTLRANFDRLFEQANSRTDVIVRSATKVRTNPGQSSRARVDATLVPAVAKVDGVAAAVPYVEGYGQLIGRDGKGIGGNGPPTRAANWVTVPSLNPYRVVEGRAPQAADEAVINRGAAKTGEFHVGETATLLTPQPIAVRIVGIVAFGSADGFGTSTFTGLTLQTAQQWLTRDPARLTEVRVQAAPGVAPAALARRVQSVLPGSTEAITGEQLAAENFDALDNGFLGLVRNGLLVFSVIALLVAAFSIFNTFSILVAQRSRESSLLRALGASRRQVVTTGAVETLAVGLVGSVIGWVAGLGLAGLLKAVFDAFGFALPAGGLVFRPASTVLAIAAGVAATGLAGILPSIRASRVAPLAALRTLAVEPPGVSRRRAAAGFVLTGLGAATAATAVSLPSAGLAALAAVACLAGVVVLGPVAARPAIAVLGRPVQALRGITGRLARENATRHPRRTAATAAALVVGVSVVALFTVFGASLKASAAKGIDDSLRADLVVDTAGYGGQTGGSGFTPRLAGDIAGVPGVRSVTALRAGSAVIDAGIRPVTVADPATLPDAVDLDLRAGTIAHLADGGIAVSERSAAERHWRPGSTVSITYPDGTVDRLTVAAVYGHRDLIGDYLIARTVWEPHDAQAIDRQILVAVAPGADPASVRSAVTTAAKPYGNARVQDRQEFRDAATEGVNTILGLIYVMLALAIVIALMGITNTLSLSIHERSRELGLLRAVGQTRRQARSMVRWESVMVAIFGTVCGVVLGTFLGWVLVKASAGATLAQFSAPPSQLVVLVVVGGMAGALAGVRPARRAARLDVLAAIDTD